jgi:single-strand DNA-binding protein
MFNRSVNKVLLVGNLGAEPEMRQMGNGNAVTNLALATTINWKNKQTGECQDKTEWHRLSVYGRLGELCAQYLKKGTKIYVEGRIENQKWQDKKTGQDRYSINIVVSEIQLLDSNNQKPILNNAPSVNNAPSESATVTTAPFVTEGKKSWGEKSSSTISQNAHYAEIEDDDSIPF